VNMNNTIEVSKDKLDRTISEIVEKLIKLHLNRIENIVIYSHHIGKLEGICELFDIDMGKIMKKAGLDEE
jgi:hypothetical protein